MLFKPMAIIAIRKVVRAVVMIAVTSELPVTLMITGCDNSVMNARRCVFGNGHQGLAIIGDQRVTNFREIWN